MLGRPGSSLGQVPMLSELRLAVSVQEGQPDEKPRRRCLLLRRTY